MVYEEEEDRIAVVKRHNKVLRKIHRQLRNTLRFTIQHSDNLFMELCNTSKEAEFALEELRLRGEMDCSPQDYSRIVELAVEALQQQRRNSTQV